jgi:hypothetical protein
VFNILKVCYENIWRKINNLTQSNKSQNDLNDTQSQPNNSLTSLDIAGIGWNEMDLDAEKKREFENHINDKWSGEQKCSVCHVQRWAILDYVYEVSEIKPRDPRNIKVTPLIQLMCLNCGNTLFFNAIYLGIYKETTKALDDTGKGSASKHGNSKT